VRGGAVWAERAERVLAVAEESEPGDGAVGSSCFGPSGFLPPPGVDIYAALFFNELILKYSLD
jgi:hypothetical protein